MKTAYLLAFVDTTQTPPVVVGAGIFSDHEAGITTELRKRRAVRVSSVGADTFGEARECMVRYVRDLETNAWLRAIMSERDGGLL